MLGKLLLLVAATIGGIYLSAPEGKNARLALLKRKAAFTPLIRELLAQAKAVLEGAQELDAAALRANLEKVVSEVKVSLNSIDFDAAVSTVREAIRLTARKLREAEAELERAQKQAEKSSTILRAATPKKVRARSTTRTLPSTPARDKRVR